MKFVFIIFKTQIKPLPLPVAFKENFILNYNLFKLFFWFLLSFVNLFEQERMQSEKEWKGKKQKGISRMWLQYLLHYSSINQWSTNESKI